MCTSEIKTLSETHPYDSLSRLVSKYLREKIIKIELKPGEKLNISQLASSLDVSRTTIREALTFLIEMSLVVQHSSSKFSVAELNTYQMFDMYTAREIIETKAGILLCESITDEQLRHLEYLAMEFDTRLKRKEYVLASDADKEFHRLIVEYCNNAFIKTMYNSIYSTIERYTSYTSVALTISEGNPFANQVINQHLMIVRALETRMPNNVATLIQRHLAVGSKLLSFPGLSLKL